MRLSQLGILTNKAWNLAEGAPWQKRAALRPGRTGGLSMRGACLVGCIGSFREKALQPHARQLSLRARCAWRNPKQQKVVLYSNGKILYLKFATVQGCRLLQ